MEVIATAMMLWVFGTPEWSIYNTLPSEERCERNYRLIKAELDLIQATSLVRGGTFRHINSHRIPELEIRSSYWWAAWYVRWHKATSEDIVDYLRVLRRMTQ